MRASGSFCPTTVVRHGTTRATEMEPQRNRCTTLVRPLRVHADLKSISAQNPYSSIGHYSLDRDWICCAWISCARVSGRRAIRQQTQPALKCFVLLSAPSSLFFSVSQLLFLLSETIHSQELLLALLLTVSRLLPARTVKALRIVGRIGIAEEESL